MSMVDPFPLLTFHDNNMFINCCCLITKGSRKMINHSIFHPFFKILGTVCCDWRIEAQKLTNMSTYWLVVSLSFLARNNPTWHIEPSWYFQHPPTPPPIPFLRSLMCISCLPFLGADKVLPVELITFLYRTLSKWVLFWTGWNEPGRMQPISQVADGPIRS